MRINTEYLYYIIYNGDRLKPHGSNRRTSRFRIYHTLKEAETAIKLIEKRKPGNYDVGRLEVKDLGNVIPF